MASVAPARRRPRLLTSVISCVVVIGVVFTGFMTWVLAFPRLDVPTRSDAVIVLGPPTVQRLRTALGVLEEGTASRLVISVPAGVRDDDSHPLVRDLCRGDTDYDVTCLTPEPFTTQGEARLASRLAQENDWSSVIVVTSVTHISRARMLFDRCLDDSDMAGRAQFISDDRDYDLRRWVSEYIYQTGAWVKALINPSC
jgi:hypothetical protein